MFPRGQILIALAWITLRASALGYGQDGHEIVGGIADAVVKDTPAGKKIYGLIDGITLRKAAFIPDEIKAWDKNGVDDPSACPHYSDHPNIDRQLRDFGAQIPQPRIRHHRSRHIIGFITRMSPS